MITVVSPSVCLSVCLSGAWAAGHSKLKIGRREANDAGEPWPHLEVKGQRSRSLGRLMLRWKMHHRPIYLWNGKSYAQTWYKYAAQWPASQICAVTSKVKGQGYNVTSSVLHVTRQGKVAESLKLGGRLSAPRWYCTTIPRLRGQRSRSPDWQMIWVDVQVNTCWGGTYCGGLSHSLLF